MYDLPLSLRSGDSGGGAPGDERAAGEDGVHDEGMERLVERTLHESVQRAGDLKKLSEMLALILQRLQVQALRIETDLATARAERSRLQRELAQYREQAQLALWEVRQREREAEGVRGRLTAELETQRLAALEDARRIRAEAERDAAELLAEAQRRRTELMGTFEPWWQELQETQQRLEATAAPPELPAGEVSTAQTSATASGDAPAPPTEVTAAEARAAPRHAALASVANAKSEPSERGAREMPGTPAGPSRAPAAEAPVTAARPVAVSASGGARAADPPARPADAPKSESTRAAEPPASQARPADRPTSGGARAPEPAGQASTSQDTQAFTEVVFLRVRDARGAAGLQRAVGSIPAVVDCRLREFERGRLVLDVEHRLGAALVDRIRGLESLDLRQTQAREGRLEFQCL